MDLEKLTPAPWRVRQSESHRDKWILADANDEYIATFEIKEAAERVALSANAFDVMMRRPWGVECIRWNDGPRTFQVVNECDRAMLHSQASDPFTALVEADRWYRENVEKK